MDEPILEIKNKYYQTTITSLENIEDFLNKEIQQWSSLIEATGISHINTYRGAFANAKEQLKTASISQIASSLSAAKIFFSLSSVGITIKEIAERTKSNESVKAFHHFLWENTLDIARHNIIMSKEVLIGYLQAYEFHLQEKSLFIERRKSEQQSLEELREQWIQNTKTLAQNFNTLKNEQTEKFNSTYQDTLDWRKKQEKEVNNLIQNATIKIQENENLYQKKLRFEKAVIYWKERADKYLKQGERWTTSLVLSCIFAIVLLIFILLQYPNILTETNKSFNFASVKGIILTLSIISFAAFLVRTFSRLAFASFHLARDAEEREQLTHIYLALKHENNLTDTYESIIIQSLFSRADTGMLGGEHSPTMPGINQILDKIPNK